jgi:hypothetical protein
LISISTGIELDKILPHHNLKKDLNLDWNSLLIATFSNWAAGVDGRGDGEGEGGMMGSETVLYQDDTDWHSTTAY